MQLSPVQWNVIAGALSWPWGQGPHLRGGAADREKQPGSPTAVEQSHHTSPVLPGCAFVHGKAISSLFNSLWSCISVTTLYPLRASFSLLSWDLLSIIRHCYWWEGVMVTSHGKTTGQEQESQAWRSEDWSSGCHLPVERPQTQQIVWSTEVICPFVPTKLLLIVNNHHE